MNFRHLHSLATSLVASTALSLGAVVPAVAQDDSDFREIETKYIFGFTTGSGIGLEGEKEVSVETIARLGKRDGRYVATETKLEFEHTPTQFIQLEFGALVSSHSIRGVTNLDDRSNTTFSGVFGEIRYLLVERGAASPFAVTASLEPTFRRIDETSGEPVHNYELEFKIAADTQLVENRVYLAFNAIYEPEVTRTPEGEWEKEATLGLSSALSFRLTPQLLIGGEVGYFRHYMGVGLNTFTGDVLFVGPTLFLQLTKKSFLTAAWATQVAGREVDGLAPLNLAEFSRHRAKVKLALEF